VGQVVSTNRINDSTQEAGHLSYIHTPSRRKKEFRTGKLPPTHSLALSHLACILCIVGLREGGIAPFLAYWHSYPITASNPFAN
jgi:hypothetical protein